MFGQIGSFVKKIFVKEGGGPNLLNLALIGGGVAAGAFGLLGPGGLLLGAGLGLGAAALKEMVMPSSPSAPEGGEETEVAHNDRSIRGIDLGAGHHNPNATLPSMAKGEKSLG